MTGMCLCGCVPVLFFADVMRMHRHVNAFLGKEKEWYFCPITPLFEATRFFLNKVLK